MAAGVGWNVPATARAGIRVVSKFVETSTEASGGFRVLEAARRFVSSLDLTMILLNPIVQILVGPVFHSAVRFGVDRAWITVVTIRRDTLRNDAGYCFARSKQCFRRRHVACLAESHIDQSAGVR